MELWETLECIMGVQSYMILYIEHRSRKNQIKLSVLDSYSHLQLGDFKDFDR